MGAADIRTPDQLTDAFHTGSTWVGQAGDFMSHQTRERPLLVSFLFVGILGSIVGSRIAQYQAMQRRRNAIEKAMESMGGLGTTISNWIFRKTSTPIDTLRYRSQDVFGATREWGNSISGGMSRIGRSQQQVMHEDESPIKQMGYALSLVPVVFAFLRNPLVRRYGFRYFGHRFMGR